MIIKNKHLRILISLLLFGVIGAYFLFGAKASEEYHVYYLDGARKIPFGVSNSFPSKTFRPAGYKLNLPVYADLQQPGPDGQLQLGLEFNGSSSTVKYLGFSCVSAAFCTGGPNTASGGDRELSTCISFDTSKAGTKQVHIATLHLEILVAGEYYNYWPGFAVWGDSPQKSLYQIWDCKHVDASGEGQGDGSGNGNGTGTGGQGAGTGGGGGGGTSATKQADQPNSTPSSSGQGENEQTKLDPSPFFDGKEYKPGSDEDNIRSTVASTGKRVVRNWPIALGVLILGGVAGYGVWKWHQRNKL